MLLIHTNDSRFSATNGRWTHGSGGKSGLRRAECWITSSEGDLRDSATESIPRSAREGLGVRSNAWGKSPRADTVTCWSVNLTRSKVEQEAFEGCPPKLPGDCMRRSVMGVPDEWPLPHCQVTAVGNRTRLTAH